MGKTTDRKKKISRKILLLIILSIAIIASGFTMIFYIYKDNIVELQKSNMLTTVRVVAKSMERYYKDKTSAFNMLFQEDVKEAKIDQYVDCESDIAAGYLVKDTGEILHSTGADYDKYVQQTLDTYKNGDVVGTAVLMPPVQTGENEYAQFLVKDVKDEADSTQYVLAAIDMEDVYRKIIQPIKVGTNGYSMVKDYDGMILMHKQKDQIGIHSVEGRREKYDQYDLDLSDLQHWFEMQQNNAEGCDIIQSYWWGEDMTRPVEKMVSFSQIKVGNEIWIVNCTLDYDELERPIFLGNVWGGIFSILMAGVFGLVIYLVINSENRTTSMEQEMNYLKELNSAFEDLRKSEEMLRHVDKVQTLGVMTGMISHEFNNFLTPIMLYGEMMQADDSLSEENKKFLEEIMESAKKSSDLTKELAHYGHRDMGIHRQVVKQVGGDVVGSLKMIRKTLPKNIQLEQQIDRGEYYAKMPVGLISQVMMNICTNALHAMKDKGGTLTVTGEVVEDQKYLITIADTGIGMPEWVVTQIFNPFYTTKKSGQGTGLGLAIVKDLIHQIKGEIRVTSKENEGTCFYITIPLCSKEDETEQINRKPSGPKHKLMILDDSATVAKALKKSFDEEFAKIQVYNHPSKALTELKKDINGYQIVITSYEQEFMNGIEFASIIRNQGFEGRIIMTYAYLDRDIKWYLENQIINVALEKPVSHSDLEAVMYENEKILKYNNN